jgi:DNA-binding response OmpR family regulator
MKRVLVVDDEPEVTFALQAYFLGKGYEVLTALDGMQAMRDLRRHSIDLALLDMKMPGLNGVEVLKFIHAQSPSTKVIVLTGYDDQFQALVERLGVDGFLMKPFGIEALTGTIEEVLGGHGISQPLSSGAYPTPGASMPKARLTFVEPSEYTYQVKEVFFSQPEKCGGIYEVTAAYSVQEVLEGLQTFRPDILLVDLAMVGPAGEIVIKAMGSESRPKELIIHGSGTALVSPKNADVKDLSRQGAKVVDNETFTQAGLIRLSQVIHKTAIANGLMGG